MSDALDEVKLDPLKLLLKGCRPATLTHLPHSSHGGHKKGPPQQRRPLLGIQSPFQRKMVSAWDSSLEDSLCHYDVAWAYTVSGSLVGWREVLSQRLAVNTSM